MLFRLIDYYKLVERLIIRLTDISGSSTTNSTKHFSKNTSTVKEEEKNNKHHNIVIPYVT